MEGGRHQRKPDLTGEAGETLARAVRRTPTHRAGNRAPWFIAATFCPVIR